MIHQIYDAVRLKKILLIDYLQTGEGVVEMVDKGNVYGYIALTKNKVDGDMKISDSMYLHGLFDEGNKSRTRDARRLMALVATGLKYEKMKHKVKGLF